MPEETVTRKLVAILYADVAGYSRLTGADEEGTHRTVAEYLGAIPDCGGEPNPVPYSRWLGPPFPDPALSAIIRLG